jgi:hypothetical protein
MHSGSSDKLQKRLIESNVKTQESAALVVKSVRELVSALKEAGESPESEMQIPKTMDEKLDKLLQQNNQLAAMLDELLRTLRQPRPLEPPPQPPLGWRKL